MSFRYLSVPPAEPAVASLPPNRSDTTATDAASTSSVGSVDSVESTSKCPPMIKIRYSSNGSRRSLACYFSCRSGRGFYTIPFPVESHLHSRSASLDGEAMYVTRDRATRPSQLSRQRLLLFNPKQQQHPQFLLPTTLPRLVFLILA